jgi:hypothetical protein
MSTNINKDTFSNLESEINDQRERISSDRMDISFGELINIYKNEELIIRPDYQRLFRWSDQQKTDLIESLLLGIPIPPIFVAEDENGVWELVDGLQRVATVISFFGEISDTFNGLTYQSTLKESDVETDDIDDEETNVSLQNKWTLGTGGILKNISGLNVDTLPTKYKINLKRAVCRVEILRGATNTAMKYELFKRLNSGGSKLTPQEMRNAIYRAVNPTINNLIAELSQSPIFKKLTKLSKQKLQELYDQELVLKFIALYNNIDNANDNTENLLNTFMQEAIKNEKFDTNYYKTKFLEVLELIDKLDNINVFRASRGAFVPAEFEGIMVGVAQNIDKYKNNLPLLAEKINSLKTDKDFKNYSGSASNSKGRIKNRLKRANDIFSQA